MTTSATEVNQPPQSLTLRAAHDQVLRFTPLGTKDSRARRSLPDLPLLASTQLHHGLQPSVTQVPLVSSGIPTPSRNFPGFVVKHTQLIVSQFGYKRQSG
eukprot:8691040-Pyramimonas_sp.AAC.1